MIDDPPRLSGGAPHLFELVAAGDVLLGLRVRDKAQLLGALAQHAARATGLTERTIAQSLEAREELGSTGLGRGFALPHARIIGLDRLFGCFARLDRAIEFQAIDGAPVDLVFMLLIPPSAGQEHVQALAAIARRFRDTNALRDLRLARSPDDAYRALVSG